jgi:hypothetical protein
MKIVWLILLVAFSTGKPALSAPPQLLIDLVQNKISIADYRQDGVLVISSVCLGRSEETGSFCPEFSVSNHRYGFIPPNDQNPSSPLDFYLRTPLSDWFGNTGHLITAGGGFYQIDSARRGWAEHLRLRSPARKREHFEYITIIERTGSSYHSDLVSSGSRRTLALSPVRSGTYDNHEPDQLAILSAEESTGMVDLRILNFLSRLQTGYEPRFRTMASFTQQFHLGDIRQAVITQENPHLSLWITGIQDRPGSAILFHDELQWNGAKVGKDSRRSIELGRSADGLNLRANMSGPGGVVFRFGPFGLEICRYSIGNTGQIEMGSWTTVKHPKLQFYKDSTDVRVIGNSVLASGSAALTFGQLGVVELDITSTSAVPKLVFLTQDPQHVAPTCSETIWAAGK